MRQVSHYHLFLFLSTLVRNLIEVFSCVLLYQLGYSIANILLFIFIMSLSGLLIDYFSLKINYKVSLIASSILYGISFYFLSVMQANIVNLVLFALILSASNYSYTLIRHLLALNLVDNSKKSISILLIFTYLASILSSYIGAYFMDKLSLELTSIIIIVFSLFSIIPILKLDMQIPKLQYHNVSIPIKKILFSIFEQFKVIFITLQPLYLYLYVNNNMYYIGVFQVIINIASLIVLYFVSKKIKNSHFRYLNLILCTSLFLKLNIKNNIFILFIAFLEGIGQKIYEMMSLENLYDHQNLDIPSYLMKEEMIFCISRAFILLIFYSLIKDFILILYLCIVGILISGFFIGSKTVKNNKNE